MKKRLGKALLTTSLVCAMTFGLAACGTTGDAGSTASGNESTSAGTKAESVSSGSGASGSSDIFIACSMPTTGNARFVTDDGLFKDYCEEKGYKYTSQFAEADVATQIEQIEGFISQGVDAIIVNPVDGSGIVSAINKAKDAGIKIVSFDRMVMDTPIDYYATFDNVGVGRCDGQYIVDKLDLENTDKTYNIELFTGDVGDNNAKLTFDGAMEVLQPYIDSGKLVVQSGQVEFDQVTTKDWDSGNAQTRMENILSSYYQDKNLDVVMTTYTNLSLGAITALKAAGYGTEDKPLPITTGQDAEIAAVKSMLAGEQTMSVFKDDRVLCPIAVDMAVAAVKGEDYPVNDTTTYDNGSGPLKTYLGEVQTFDLDNIQEVLFDSGYLSEDDLK